VYGGVFIGTNVLIIAEFVSFCSGFVCGLSPERNEVNTWYCLVRVWM
jgi:hypothetical protein